MAAPKKIGLGYYSTDTDRYNDIKIKRLKKACGPVGVAVYDYILCEIYRVKGCFMGWDESVAFEVSEYWSLKESTVDEIVNCCCAVGLFNKDLYASGKVLTSRSIQFRYAKVCQDAKRTGWFIPKEIDLTTELMPILPVITAVTSVNNGQSRVKDSKVKDSKMAPPEQKTFYFRVRGHLVAQKLSEYFPTNFADWLNVWKSKNDTAPDFPLTKQVLKLMDEKYLSHAFTDENHIRNSFGWVYETKVKNQSGSKVTIKTGLHTR